MKLLSLDLRNYDRYSPGVNANCEVADNGKYYYVETSKLDSAKLYTYQPIHKDLKITKSRDGVYAYIIASTEKEEAMQDASIYAIRTLTIHEIKTKHAHLVNRLNKISSKSNGKGIRYLHYAGEFLKEGDNISFNFMSGTYMAENIPLIKSDEDVNNNRHHIDYVKAVFKKHTNLNAEITTDSLIDKSQLTLTKRDIDTLVKYGAEVYEYDNRSDCEYRNKYKGLYGRQIAQHTQKLRVFERTNKEIGKTPPVFVKPESPLQGELLLPQESPTTLGKRKKSSNETVSSAETSLRARKTRKTVHNSNSTRGKSVRRTIF